MEVFLNLIIGLGMAALIFGVSFFLGVVIGTRVNDYNGEDNPDTIFGIAWFISSTLALGLMLYIFYIKGIGY